MRSHLLLGIGCALVALGGCRYQAGASFLTATTPILPIGHPQDGQWKGDPYANGGIASASGGTIPGTRYAAGANQNAHAPLNAKYDQPAMGIGQGVGDYPVSAAPGFGNSNAPGLQPSPSSVNTPAANVGQ